MLYVNALRCVGEKRNSADRAIVGRKMNRNEFERKLGNRIFFLLSDRRQTRRMKRDERMKRLKEREIYLSCVK